MTAQLKKRHRSRGSNGTTHRSTGNYSDAAIDFTVIFNLRDEVVENLGRRRGTPNGPYGEAREMHSCGLCSQQCKPEAFVAVRGTRVLAMLRRVGPKQATHSKLVCTGEACRFTPLIPTCKLSKLVLSPGKRQGLSMLTDKIPEEIVRIIRGYSQDYPPGLLAHVKHMRRLASLRAPRSWTQEGLHRRWINGTMLPTWVLLETKYPAREQPSPEPMSDEFTDCESDPETSWEFDSTLGFPGEGPPRRERPLGCNNCGALDHFWRDCPLRQPPDSSSDDESVDDGGPAEAGWNDDDEHELKRLEIITDLQSKSQVMWASRSLASQEEFTSVLRSLAQIARVRGLHDHDPDSNLTQILHQICNAGRSEALAIRLASARRRAERNLTMINRRGHFARFHNALKQFWSGFRDPMTQCYTEDYQELEALEKEPQAPPRSRWSVLGVFAHFGATMLTELLEEVVKKFLHVLLVRYFRVTGGPRYYLLMCLASAMWSSFEAAFRGLNFSQFLYLFVMHSYFSVAGLKLGLFTAWITHFMHNLFVTAKINRMKKALIFSVDDVCCEEQGLKGPPQQNGFKVRWGETECQAHFGARCMWGVAGYTATVFRQCSCNEKIAIQGRVGKELPSHGRQAQITGNWRRVSRQTLPLLAKHIRPVNSPVPIDEWLSSFPPTRREELKKDYLAVPGEDDKAAKGFVKREIAPKPLHDLTFKDPRWIQGCPLWMSRTCGPWLRKLAKHTARLAPRQQGRGYSVSDIVDGRQIIYSCGLNTNAIGEAFGRALETLHGMRVDSNDRVVVVEDDESRFDMHILKGPFGFLDQVYRKFIRKKNVARALRRTSGSLGYGLRGTKYSVPYTMQSGWPDTSVGDTLVNAAMKIEIHGSGRPWISIICGDDSVTVTLQSELDRIGGEAGIRTSYESFGMEVEVQIRLNPLDTEFCSSRFFPWRHTYVLMPKPGRLLAKIGWDMKDRNPRDQLAWVRGISKTLQHYGSVDPLLFSLGAALAEQAGVGKTIEEHNPYKLQLGARLPDRDLAGVQLYYSHHYGLSTADIDTACSQLRAAGIGVSCDHPVILSLVEKDLG